MKMSSKQMKFARNIRKLLDFAESIGFDVTFGEATRPELMQQHYMKTGKTTIRYSQHQKKLAMDLNFFINGKYVTGKGILQVLGDYWESLDDDNRWGGNWKTFVDTPHFEMRG